MYLLGDFGFFENELLEMTALEGGKYVFTTEDLSFAQEHQFVFNGYYYGLAAEKNTNIRAFSMGTHCRYKDGKYAVITINANNCNLVYMLPHWETFQKLDIHNPYDDGWTIVNIGDWERDVEEIWQVREPINGFVFDVDPIVYIKKKGEPIDEEKWKRISDAVHK